MTKHLKTPRPQIVFKQSLQSMHRWQGRLLNRAACVDTRTGLPAEGARFDITENPRTGRCSVLVQGATYHGRRYVSYESLDAAQAGGARWAGRRFRLNEE